MFVGFYFEEDDYSRLLIQVVGSKMRITQEWNIGERCFGETWALKPKDTKGYDVYV